MVFPIKSLSFDLKIGMYLLTTWKWVYKLWLLQFLNLNLAWWNFEKFWFTPSISRVLATLPPPNWGLPAVILGPDNQVKSFKTFFSPWNKKRSALNIWPSLRRKFHHPTIDFLGAFLLLVSGRVGPISCLIAASDSHQLAVRVGRLRGLDAVEEKFQVYGRWHWTWGEMDL